MSYHNPVLLFESIDGLEIDPSGVYVDVTFGGGGHSREILKRLDENGKLFAFDQDADALGNVIEDEDKEYFLHIQKKYKLIFFCLASV